MSQNGKYSIYNIDIHYRNQSPYHDTHAISLSTLSNHSYDLDYKIKEPSHYSLQYCNNESSKGNGSIEGSSEDNKDKEYSARLIIESINFSLFKGEHQQEGVITMSQDNNVMIKGNNMQKQLSIKAKGKTKGNVPLRKYENLLINEFSFGYHMVNLRKIENEINGEEGSQTDNANSYLDDKNDDNEGEEENNLDKVQSAEVNLLKTHIKKGKRKQNSQRLNNSNNSKSTIGSNKSPNKTPINKGTTNNKAQKKIISRTNNQSRSKDNNYKNRVNDNKNTTTAKQSTTMSKTKTVSKSVPVRVKQKEKNKEKDNKDEKNALQSSEARKQKQNQYKSPFELLLLNKKKKEKEASLNKSPNNNHISKSINKIKDKSKDKNKEAKKKPVTQSQNMIQIKKSNRNNTKDLKRKLDQTNEIKGQNFFQEEKDFVPDMLVNQEQSANNNNNTAQANQINKSKFKPVNNSYTSLVSLNKFQKSHSTSNLEAKPNDSQLNNNNSTNTHQQSKLTLTQQPFKFNKKLKTTQDAKDQKSFNIDKNSQSTSMLNHNNNHNKLNKQFSARNRNVNGRQQHNSFHSSTEKKDSNTNKPTNISKNISNTNRGKPSSSYNHYKVLPHNANESLQHQVSKSLMLTKKPQSVNSFSRYVNNNNNKSSNNRDLTDKESQLMGEGNNDLNSDMKSNYHSSRIKSSKVSLNRIIQKDKINNSLIQIIDTEENKGIKAKTKTQFYERPLTNYKSYTNFRNIRIQKDIGVQNDMITKGRKQEGSPIQRFYEKKDGFTQTYTDYFKKPVDKLMSNITQKQYDDKMNYYRLILQNPFNPYSPFYNTCYSNFYQLPMLKKQSKAFSVLMPNADDKLPLTGTSLGSKSISSGGPQKKSSCTDLGLRPQSQCNIGSGVYTTKSKSKSAHENVL